MLKEINNNKLQFVNVVYREENKMSKYFIDDNIYFQGKKQIPRKVKLTSVTAIDDEKAICYDENGDSYTLELSKIYDEE